MISLNLKKLAKQFLEGILPVLCASAEWRYAMKSRISISTERTGYSTHTNGTRLGSWLLAFACILATTSVAAGAAHESEVPAGTRFVVELGTKLDATRINRGKKFDAWTVEPIEATNGDIIPAGTKLKGEVTYVKKNDLVLRFERIETGWGKLPLVASVVSVEGEKGVMERVNDEDEIKASGGRGKDAAIGALVGGGAGAAVGASKAGGKGAAIGAGAGSAIGALIGAAAGGKHLVLHKGTRIELQLDRPLVLISERY